jgi:hypothetical protein
MKKHTKIKLNEKTFQKAINILARKLDSDDWANDIYRIVETVQAFLIGENHARIEAYKKLDKVIAEQDQWRVKYLSLCNIASDICKKLEADEANDYADLIAKARALF